MLDEKDIYIERLTQQLEQWKAEIADLEDKTESAADDIKGQCENALDALKQYYDATEAKLEEWVESSDDVWETLEDKAEQQLNTASSAMKSAITHIKSLFS